MSGNLLTIAQDVAAGKLWILVGENGVPVAVTSDGLISSVDETVRSTVNDSTYGNEALYNLLTSGAVDIDLNAIIADIGDPSSRTNLSSIEAIIGWQDVNANQTIGAVLSVDSGDRYESTGSIGTDFGTLLDSRLTAARAINLDELGSSNMPADLDTLTGRLTALRAGYLDELDFDLSARLGSPDGISLAADLVTIDTVVDSNSTELAHGTYGLSAIKTLVDTSITDIGTVNSDLSNATDGLGALKTLIDANQTDLNTLISDVSTVDTNVNTINTDLSNATDGLGALKSLIDENQVDLNSIITNTNTTNTDLSNATDGLGALKALIDENQTDLNTVITDVSTVNGLVDDLETRLTLARAGYLDNINNSNLTTIGANITLSNINSEVDTALDTAILTPTADSIAERIETLDDNYTVTRAGYLDELSSANIPTDIDTLLTRLSSARAADLDYIEASAIGTPTAGSIAERVKTLDDNYTSTRAGYIDNLSGGAVALAANQLTDAVWTDTRAGYIDNLSAGAVALASTALSSSTWTNLRAGYLDELDFDLSTRLGSPAGASLAADLLTIDNLVDDLETRLTAARAGYLDELDFDLTARLGTPAGASLSADLLTLDNTINSATIGLSKVATELSGSGTNGTFSYLVAGAEQDVLEFSKTNIYSILSLDLDLTNFTSGRVLTVRIYKKVDGVTYRKLDEVFYTAGTHDAVSISPMLNLDHNVKFTMEIDTVESGNINVPYRYVLSDFT